VFSKHTQKRDDGSHAHNISKIEEAIDMMSSAVVIEFDHEKGLRNRATSGESIDTSSHNDADDFVSCRTDQTTVRASNVRRVTVSGIGFDGENQSIWEKGAKTPMPFLVVLNRTRVSHTISLVVFHLLQLTPTMDPNQETAGVLNETCTALKARLFVI
jgi:hypothetical protein